MKTGVKTCRYCEAADKLMAQASVLEETGAQLSCLFGSEAKWRAHRDSPDALDAYTNARDLLALAGDLLEIDRIERGENDPWS